MMTRIDWVSGGLLLLAWLLPLHVPPWLSWHNELVGAAALLAPCAMALFFSRKTSPTERIRLPVVAMPLVLLAAIALLQVSIGVIAYWGSFWVVAFYAAVAVAAAAAGYATGPTEVQRPDQGRPASAATGTALTVLAKVLLAAAIAQLFVVFSQTFYLWEGSDWIARTVYRTRGSGNLGQPNQAALVFLMGVASVVHLYRRGQVRGKIAFIGILLLCAGLAATESRSGVLGFCGLAAWWACKGGAARRWQAMAPAGGFILALLAMYLAWPPLIGRYWFLDLAAGPNLTTSGRVEMWRQLLEAVLMHPWLGWGVMQVAQAQNAVAHAYPSVMAATFGHNLLLDIVLWAGVPAACAFLLMVGTWTVRRLRAARSEDAWYCIALALPMAIQSMTEFPYAYIYFLVPVFFALGALDASLGFRPQFSIGCRGAKVLFAVGIGAFSLAAIEYVRIEDDFRVARFEALRVGRVPAAHEQPKVVLLTQLGALLDGTRIQPTRSMPRAEVETLKNVAMLYPWPPAKFRYLAALALNGQPDEARRQLRMLDIMHGRAVYIAAQERLAEMSDSYPELKELAAP